MAAPCLDPSPVNGERKGGEGEMEKKGNSSPRGRRQIARSTSLTLLYFNLTTVGPACVGGKRRKGDAYRASPAYSPWASFERPSSSLGRAKRKKGKGRRAGDTSSLRRLSSTTIVLSGDWSSEREGKKGGGKRSRRCCFHSVSIHRFAR